MNRYILINDELKIVGFTSSSEIYKNDSNYNPGTRIRIISEEVYKYLIEESKNNEIILIEEKNKSIANLAISNFKLTPIVRKKVISKEEALAKGIMDTTLKEVELSNQTKGLAMGVLSNSLASEKLSKQINALSKALFEMSLKK